MIISLACLMISSMHSERALVVNRFKVNLTKQRKLVFDNDKIVATILMDLRKAFDCLPHKLLISKLYAYGFNLNACMFIATYLTSRKMRIKHHGAKSGWSVMTKGVPQGSVMEPVIFNIFSNDLHFVVQCYIYNFADDNTIAENEKDLEVLLRELSDKTGIVCNGLMTTQ